MVAPSQLPRGPANRGGCFAHSLRGWEGSPARQRLAVLFVLPAQLEEQDRPLRTPSLFQLPRAPSLLTSLCCLFPAASEPGGASSANARRRILCPFASRTAAMTEGEDPAASRSTGPALCRGDQGILMPEPHPPDSGAGKRILLLNSLLGVFVSTPLRSPSCC